LFFRDESEARAHLFQINNSSAFWLRVRGKVAMCQGTFPQAPSRLSIGIRGMVMPVVDKCSGSPHKLLAHRAWQNSPHIFDSRAQRYHCGEAALFSTEFELIQRQFSSFHVFRHPEVHLKNPQTGLASSRSITSPTTLPAPPVAPELIECSFGETP
jgi:hypothetical protein